MGDERTGNTARTVECGHLPVTGKRARDFIKAGKIPHVVNAPDKAEIGTQPFFLGRHESIRQVFDLVDKFARVADPVLVLGETGTGKELAAQAIHARSARACGPFVAVNCGALPRDLAASELFGHERGAFTGATQRRAGKFEMADGGTLFLDEIGDLPPDLQGHLLRVLQDHTIERLGGSTDIRVSLRVVAATNADLRQAVADGRFRRDLYHRLNFLSIEMPPLRARGDDVLVLAEAFTDAFAAELGTGPCRLAPCARAAIRSHTWPGNVRELIGTLRRALIVCPGGELAASDIGLDTRSEPARTRPSPQVSRSRDIQQPISLVRSKMERRLLKRALARNRNQVALAAEDYGVARGTFYKLMRQHGVTRTDGAAGG